MCLHDVKKNVKVTCDHGGGTGWGGGEVINKAMNLHVGVFFCPTCF